MCTPIILLNAQLARLPCLFGVCACMNASVCVCVCLSPSLSLCMAVRVLYYMCVWLCVVILRHLTICEFDTVSVIMNEPTPRYILSLLLGEI